ncbi:hypothetical protein H0H93_008724 [Arthromyces matolae]|nr:hypothetical protein H0H93_008724 [Arthromyces matolae]
MARNEEKAQSMLYRFREAQAAELGLGTRGHRRPRMASACKSLRECERWRGEILREISRKVSKIQDAGLSDYEVRDLNVEINKIVREKCHWENQIVALGGANYRRNVAMLDDDGKEVPGTKGYKYFGCAKDLPGVRELFQSKKSDEEEENQALAFYKKFTNQGPSYFGDLDENDGNLLSYERAAEEEDWEEAYSNLRETLGLSTEDPIPPLSLGDHLASSSHVDIDMAGPDSDSINPPSLPLLQIQLILMLPLQLPISLSYVPKTFFHRNFRPARK